MAELTLAVPMKLDAFVFNESVCNGQPQDAKIAPITQPNYTFLQLEDGLIQNDILDHVDLHNAIPSTSNPRLYDLGMGQMRTNRLGVYLHWVLPRFYRTGIASTPSAASSHAHHRQQKGLGTAGPTPDVAAPVFRPLPNRWLVIRTLDPNASTTHPQGTSIPAVEAWVVESDRHRSIDEATLKDADLQVDISPYITSTSKNIGNIKLAEQAETFIGYKSSAANWKEDPSQPRIDITAVSSSNQLFVDYQPHCGNVFSTLDTFEYAPGSTLDRARANYYVLGWHSTASDGPLGNMAPAAQQTRKDRLRELSMNLSGEEREWTQEIQDWLASYDPGTVLCHGAMYQVEWDRSTLPKTVPANDASHQLLETMSVAVGTTPIDSLLTYIDSHQDSQLEKDLHNLGPLLRAQDEGVAARRLAKDEVQNWNFAREAGGQHWHLQNTGEEKPTVPTTEESDRLEALNQAQRVVDSTNRQILQLRWQMFSYWWKYVSSPDRGTLILPIKGLADTISRLKDIADKQQEAVSRLALTFTTRPQEAVLAEFHQPRDPTVLVGGIRAGWPDDYLDSLRVRVCPQFIAPKGPVDLTAYCTSVLPNALTKTAEALVQEFVTLSSGTVTPPEPGHYYPLYHDPGRSPTDGLRDQWNDIQPWAPLFLEWEAEYIHVPWKDDNDSPYWSLIGTQKDVYEKQWRLGITPGKDLQNPQLDDSRTLSGRILLLPQPTFSLQAAIDQLFASVNPDILDKILPTPERRKEVKENTYKLPFLSAPLDGFTDHLLTVVQGTHIKPNARYPDKGLQPIADAVVGPFEDGHLNLIGIHSELTPYASLFDFSNTTAAAAESSDEELKLNPFKPVTHGQFRFMKLNIVDKFGQAISAIDPRYVHEDYDAVYPHLSEYFSPQELSGRPNVVRSPNPKHPDCNEFVQMPPGINQHARLNAAFVKHDRRSEHSGNSYSYWRPVTEWETPIWGWIVLNYVDSGIQVFLPDGTFYREVRLAASPDAPHVTKGAKWLPFDPPPKTPGDTQQLDNLLAKLADKDQTYLLAFLAMANASLDGATTTPSAYASFLNTLVGRPLALVNAGWSLELAIKSKENQATLDEHTEKQPRMGLLPDDGPQQYSFPIKLGDKDRAADGLVGYFQTRSSPLSPGEELDLDRIFTYYPAGDTSGHLQEITTANLPSLPAFWQNPEQHTGHGESVEETAQRFTRDWNQAFQVYGAILDPFQPVTAYSSILPMTPLQLPPWTWQDAMQKMTAFFHMGPIVLTDDVEAYRSGAPLTQDYKLTPPNQDQTVKGSAVGIPSLKSGSWAWLQPFEEEKERGGQEEEPKPVSSYRALGLGNVSNQPKYQAGPYTAIEGYLQLKEPIIRPEVPKT
ncbi:hypothetical protein BBP40_002379 [Aspergillus hancockii]|nr:hypothetical protein BBP40_002379 [Aspergillus hancockii]